MPVSLSPTDNLNTLTDKPINGSSARKQEPSVWGHTGTVAANNIWSSDGSTMMALMRILPRFTEIAAGDTSDRMRLPCFRRTPV